MQLNRDAITTLIERNQSDRATLDFIFRVLMDFEYYHQAVYALECKAKVYGQSGTLARQEYQEMIASADQSRTITHNSLLGMMNAINRLSAKAKLPPVYDGIVSEERPYRREVADAVFDFVQAVIMERR